MDTLVLNSFRLPIQLVSWRKAFTMIVSGRAEVLEEYEDRAVKTAWETFQIPAVIRLLKTAVGFFRRGPRFNRSNIYLRDKGKCQYCGRAVTKTEFQIEHVVPRAQGGRTIWTNCVTSCNRCNQRKQDKTPRQAGMRLLSKPVRPKSLPGMFSPVIQWSKEMPTEWRDFIASVDYWHGTLESG